MTTRNSHTHHTQAGKFESQPKGEVNMILELIALIGLAVIAAGLVIGGWE